MSERARPASSGDGPVRIALLRAVNLAGRNRVGMAELRAFCANMGLEQPRTLLQSGNVVFGEVEGRTTAALESLLEREAVQRLGVGTEFFVRTTKEWEAAVAGNPFGGEAERDPSHLLLMCLKAAPSAGDVAALQASITGRETVRAEGRQLFITYPDGVGRSKLTAGRIERALGTRGTARNWNTVLKLREAARVLAAGWDREEAR